MIKNKEIFSKIIEKEYCLIQDYCYNKVVLSVVQYK